MYDVGLFWKMRDANSKRVIKFLLRVLLDNNYRQLAYWWYANFKITLEIKFSNVCDSEYVKALLPHLEKRIFMIFSLPIS